MDNAVTTLYPSHSPSPSPFYHHTPAPTPCWMAIFYKTGDECNEQFNNTDEYDDIYTWNSNDDNWNSIDDFSYYDEEDYDTTILPSVVFAFIFVLTIAIIICVCMINKTASSQGRTTATTPSRPPQQPAASPQQTSRTNSTINNGNRAISESSQNNPQWIRSKVIHALFPEERIDRSQLRIDSQANSYRVTSKSGEKGNTSCCICLEKFHPDDIILSGLVCSHGYHRECILGWVEVNDSCPVCRQRMFDEETYQIIQDEIVHLDV